jgi:hypothetical protein
MLNTILGGTIGFQGPLVQPMATSNIMLGPSNPTQLLKLEARVQKQA